MSNINEAKIIGGKRKNGHKHDCSCHICENMMAKAKRNGYEEDMKKEKERKMGGVQKKNGHKKDCSCPICKNMKNAKNKNKKGGSYDDESSSDEDMNGDESSSDEDLEEEAEMINMNAGKKKSNGHKKDCSCPICKNMKKGKNKKNKKGGADEDIKEMASVLEVEKTDNNNLDVSKDEEYENLDDIPVSKGGKKRGTRKTNKFN
jgi:hypothetical protein